MELLPVWLAAGVRSPFGRFGGGLRDVDVVDLGVSVVRQLRERQWPFELVRELIVGMAMIEGGLMVPARQVAVRADLPYELPTLTVDRACCSGLTAAALAARAVKDGAESALALGLESMSRTPRLLHDTRWDQHRGDLVAEDLLLLRSPLTGTSIAYYVGHESTERGVDRDQQDRWAVQSHRRYFRAQTDGRFEEEIVPIRTNHGLLTDDEQPRQNTSYEAVAALPTVYGSPTVTAGNAPGLNDGACALLLASDNVIGQVEATPLARICMYHQIAGTPTSAVYLPGLAIRDMLAKAGLTPDDLSVIEINEAFAATPLVSVKAVARGDPELEERLLERTNPNGGAVAIGHPTGATGARLLLTAARELRRRGGRWAAVAICGGFGQTDAMLIENA